jgi:hypothetical protein
MDKPKAVEKLENEIARGKTVALAEEDKMDLNFVCLKVGNLKPSQKAIVSLRFISKINMDLGYYIVKIPKSLFPNNLG